VWRWLAGDAVIAAVTWIGTIVGGVGLALTYIQARKARAAAEAASIAVQSLARLNSIGHVAYAYAQIELVRQLVQSEQLFPAQTVFHSAKRFIETGFQAARKDGPARAKIEQAMRIIAIVDSHLAYGIARDKKFNAIRTVRALTGLGAYLAELEHELTRAEMAVSDEDR